MRIEGSVLITEQISDKLTILLRYQKIRFGSKDLTRPTEFPIPQPCSMLTKRTIFGEPIGNSFKPRLTCPPKPGTYKFNFTFSLKKVADIPDSGTKYFTSILMLDPKIKSKKVWCEKVVIWMRSL